MDLITYLKNTNNEELYQKLKEIVKLYKEREKYKRNLIFLINDYNILLTNKYERTVSKKNNNKPLDKSPLLTLSIISMMVPSLLLIIILLIAPPQLLATLLELLVLLLVFLIMLMTYLSYCEISKKEKLVVEKKYMDMIENLDQEKKYKRLCKARELYHAKRKELDNMMLNISKKELELIDNFYGTLKEYDDLLDHIAMDLEEKKQIPQTEPQTEKNKTLEHII